MKHIIKCSNVQTKGKIINQRREANSKVDVSAIAVKLLVRRNVS